MSEIGTPSPQPFPQGEGAVTYKGALTAAMTELGRDPLVRFVGYGLKPAGVGIGTFAGAPPNQIIETPVAENLMVGVAIGLALRGLRPVVHIERFDFILNALDAIVNHLDKLETLSRGVYRPALILRVVAGNHTKPLYTGPTHTQDFTEALSGMISFSIMKPDSPSNVQTFYEHAQRRLENGQSTLLVERKDLL